MSYKHIYIRNIHSYNPWDENNSFLCTERKSAGSFFFFFYLCGQFTPVMQILFLSHSWIVWDDILRVN